MEAEGRPLTLLCTDGTTDINFFPMKPGNLKRRSPMAKSPATTAGNFMHSTCLQPLDNLCKSQEHFFPFYPMKTGRPPLWNPVSALGWDVWTDVIPLASKGRVVLPVTVRGRLPWLANAQDGVLVRADPGRRAELMPWKPNGEDMLARVKNALQAANDAEQDVLALAAMDRYFRLSMEGVGRTSLPPPLASMLEAEAAGCIRVVMMAGRLWLWSERRWIAERSRRVALLDSHGIEV